MGAAEFDEVRRIGDVADALKFVPGVNVVEGQFAIIRGLEDRYSSTLYNGAPVPSPDPDRQSVQLDLFPSDIVSEPRRREDLRRRTSPSNSSGGSINILTHDYPEEFEFKLSGGTRLQLERLGHASSSSTTARRSAARPTAGTRSRATSAGSIGGRTEALDREIRFKAIVNNEIDYETAEGTQHEARAEARRDTSQPCQPGDRRTRGDLALGELSLSATAAST